jgi:hypothetical protein
VIIKLLYDGKHRTLIFDSLFSMTANGVSLNTVKAKNASERVCEATVLTTDSSESCNHRHHATGTASTTR